MPSLILIHVRKLLNNIVGVILVIKLGLHVGLVRELFHHIVGVLFMLILVLNKVLRFHNVIGVFLMVLQLKESVILPRMLLGFFVVAVLLLRVASFVVGGANALAAIEVVLDGRVIALMVLMEEPSIVAVRRKLSIMQLLMVITHSLNILRRIGNGRIVGREVVRGGLVAVDFILTKFLVLHVA